MRETSAVLDAHAFARQTGSPPHFLMTPRKRGEYTFCYLFPSYVLSLFQREGCHLPLHTSTPPINLTLARVNEARLSAQLQFACDWWTQMPLHEGESNLWKSRCCLLRLHLFTTFFSKSPSWQRASWLCHICHRQWCHCHFPFVPLIMEPKHSNTSDVLRIRPFHLSSYFLSKVSKVLLLYIFRSSLVRCLV